MSDADALLVDSIRTSSRQLVRELGFMQPTLAATDHPPSAVHAILEIGSHSSRTAAQLAADLNLEKSSVSRMLRKLVDAGELREDVGDDDGRQKMLTLTPKGLRTLAIIDAFGRQQVRAATSELSSTDRKAVDRGLALYANALEQQRRRGTGAGAATTLIDRGYRPGVIGRVAEMHATFYARSVGFGQFFESQVASGMAEFAARLGHPRNGLWTATQSGRIFGSIAIDGEDLGDGGAHLRWFIVDDGLRAAGVGQRLLDTALAWCDAQGDAPVHLWTFRGLDAARRLYERAGFVLTDERPGNRWGAEVVEQHFVRPCRGSLNQGSALPPRSLES